MDESLGCRPDELLPADLSRHIIDSLQQVFATGAPITGLEISIPAPNSPNAMRHWLLSYDPVPDAQGETQMVGTCVVDITSQKQAEVDAAAANRSKDEFLAMLGHELRNPLSPIVSSLEIMQRRLGELGAQERAVIDRQVRRLARLVDDLTDVSRISRGKLELQKRSIEISAVIAQAIETTDPTIKKRQHQLKVSVPERGLRVSADEHRLTQVMTNLLGNAAKYTDPGGTIDVVAGKEDDQVVVRIRDSGIGIRKEDLPRIFQRFVQEERALDRSEGGLGLGLSIVSSLVAMHGGQVSAHSPGIGQGSEFVVRLPLL
jgi:signal transduction histidine kinase